MGFDIGAVILSALHNKILLKGGGHKMAGGFSIEESKIDKFKQFIIKKFKSKINQNSNKDYFYLDSLITASAINLDFYEKVEKLSPFGSGNPSLNF